MRSTEPDSYDSWRETYRRIDWEQSFRDGRWDYLSNVGQVPRNGILAGYVHSILGRGSVLDAGCGDGTLIDYLDLERFAYTGIDISPTALERAQARLRRGTLLECRIEDFRPPEGVTYDAIVFNEVIQATVTPLESLDRYRGFLSERGVMLLSFFKNPDESANGPRLKRFVDAEIEKGRYTLVDRAVSVSPLHDLAHDIVVLR